MKCEIIGTDWDLCYLHNVPERKQQVLKDLQIETDRHKGMLWYGDILEIEVKDNSTAVELFRVEDLRPFEDTAIFSYSGGAS